MNKNHSYYRTKFDKKQYFWTNIGKINYKNVGNKKTKARKIEKNRGKEQKNENTELVPYFRFLFRKKIFEKKNNLSKNKTYYYNNEGKKWNQEDVWKSQFKKPQ